VEWWGWHERCGLCTRVSESIQTGRLELELQMVQFSATRCSCVAIWWASLVSFAAMTLCVAPQRVFIIVVYLFIDSVRRLLDSPSYIWLMHQKISHLLRTLLHFVFVRTSSENKYFLSPFIITAPVVRFLCFPLSLHPITQFAERGSQYLILQDQQTMSSS
jgi:hypothetical protein